MKKIQVEVWSDIACPFCYIGKRKFEESLNHFNHKEDVEINWKSFQLMPDAKKENDITMNEMLAERYGKTVEWAKQMNDSVTETAKEAGLDFNLDIAKFTNTLDGHRLIHLAAEHGLQDKAKEKLLSAYFAEGKNVSNKETLIQIGKEIGLKPDEVKQMLESDKFIKDVKEDIMNGQKLGLTGVPFFVFNRKYAVSGAQSSDIFLDVLKKSWQDIN